MKLVGLVLAAVLLAGCARVGDGVARVGGWIKSLDPVQEEVTYSKRRVAR